MKKLSGLTITAVVTLAGCSSGTEPTGSDPTAGDSVAVAAALNRPTLPVVAGCDHRLAAYDPVQIWTGYAENAQGLASEITLLFAALDQARIAGEVVFGDGSVEAYPTPPADSIQDTDFAVQAHQPLEGFAYTMLEPTRSGDRIRFSVSAAEQWCSWCGEQTPYEGGPFGYSCAPNWAGRVDGGQCLLDNPATGLAEEWDCTVVDMCVHLMLCDCTGSGCGAALQGPAPTYSFDLTLDDETQATGSMNDSVVRFAIDQTH